MEHPIQTENPLSSIWREAFAKWPSEFRRKGVVLPSYGEAIPFVDFVLNEDMVVLERATPDTVGSRRVAIPFRRIEALKYTEPLKTEQFLSNGFANDSQTWQRLRHLRRHPTENIRHQASRARSCPPRQLQKRDQLGVCTWVCTNSKFCKDEAMLPQFPKAHDQYPMIDLKETDIDLPSHVVNKNNTRYANFKTLARGGKCLIQACKDYHLRRTVCYKSLLPQVADDPYEQKRFLREARVTAMLQHPNTVPVYELSRNSRGHYYFTMKLIEGLTLREILEMLKKDHSATNTQWPLDRLLEILVQVCHALNYVHSHGVVHRDIKPGNIVVGPFGEVLLLDWGLAKVWDMDVGEIPKVPLAQEVDQSLTALGGLQATPLYMSPEQVAEAKDIDQRTDIYSLGAVLYEVLTLESMAWGETMYEMLSHTEHDAPMNPSERAPDRFIPEHLEAVCLQCIEKKPGARVQTVAELIEQLQKRVVVAAVKTSLGNDRNR